MTRNGIRPSRVAVLGLCAGLLIVSVSAIGQNPAPVDPRIFPPNSHPHGKTYGEWAELYLRANFDVPYDPSLWPLAQVGKVIFLDATGGGPGIWTGTVRPGTALFFPVVTSFGQCPFLCGPGSPAPYGTVEELTAFAIESNNQATVLECEIDGVPVANIENYRTLTPVWSGVIHPLSWPGSLGLSGNYWNSIADGYWIMIKPLPPGPHDIHFRVVFGDPGNPTWYSDNWHFVFVQP